ncbi:hypothetical protein [Verminephrobacter eiseniae]|uniref:hypothetical protein n=1 Tax=Verminephrobacter eiseniae TaxID=364317 RepID=UPI0010DAAFF3|nr:hypothetical protein [Verminephrobacter eiseniae]KAB7575671.1 hypothetical protein ET532_019030 [Verminephrobacter sp. Larva24]
MSVQQHILRGTVIEFAQTQGAIRMKISTKGMPQGADRYMPAIFRDMPELTFPGKPITQGRAPSALSLSPFFLGDGGSRIRDKLPSATTNLFLTTGGEIV